VGASNDPPSPPDDANLVTLTQSLNTEEISRLLISSRSHRFPMTPLPIWVLVLLGEEVSALLISYPQRDLTQATALWYTPTIPN
jgi:hypothetical protein